MKKQDDTPEFVSKLDADERHDRTRSKKSKKRKRRKGKVCR
jgi:hypothetical protein